MHMWMIMRMISISWNPMWCKDATRLLPKMLFTYCCYFDFWKLWVWTKTLVNGLILDVDENVKVEDKKTEASFNFGKVLKTFVYGVLDKGDIGLPWHTLLLYLCHDAHKPLGMQKAFSVLGGCMYSLQFPWPTLIIPRRQQHFPFGTRNSSLEP